MFVPTKATVKLANVNTGHAQVVGIILCCFPNCPIIYTVGPVYYFPGHPSNTISSVALNFYLDLKILHLNLLKIVTFLNLEVVLGYLPPDPNNSWLSSTRNYQDNSSQRQEYCSPNYLWTFKTNFLSTYSSEFWSFIYHKNNNKMEGKGLMEGLLENLPELE